MTTNYDNETKRIQTHCENCGHDSFIDVKAEVEVNTYISIKED